MVFSIERPTPPAKKMPLPMLSSMLNSEIMLTIIIIVKNTLYKKLFKTLQIHVIPDEEKFKKLEKDSK